jgi:hypothetical protein
MCDPVSLTVAAVAATVITAGSQIYAGAAANAQGKYQAKIANQNAALERENVKDAQGRQAIEQQRHWRKVAAAMGMQRAQAGALGLDTDFGSVGDLQNDTLMIGYEDATTINENYAKEIKGYDINAANYVMEGRAAKARGKAALVSGFMQGASTILGRAAQCRRRALTHRRQSRTLANRSPIFASAG